MRPTLLLLLLLAGCHEDPLGPPGAADFAGVPADGAPAADDLASPNACAPWVFAADVAGEPRWGRVALFQNDAATLAFSQPGGLDAALDTVGPCRGGAGMPIAFAPVSDGKITISGGAGPIVLGPGASQASFPPGPTLWSGGELLHFDAAGAVAPPWQASLLAPVAATVTAPVVNAFGKVDVARGKPLHVAWQPVPAGWMVVELIARPPLMPAIDYVCVFDARAGAGDVPAEVTFRMAQTGGTFTAASACDLETDAAGWRVVVEAYGTPLGANAAFH